MACKFTYNSYNKEPTRLYHHLIISSTLFLLFISSTAMITTCGLHMHITKRQTHLPFSEMIMAVFFFFSPFSLLSRFSFPPFLLCPTFLAPQCLPQGWDGIHFEGGAWAIRPIPSWEFFNSYGCDRTHMPQHGSASFSG